MQADSVGGYLDLAGDQAEAVPQCLRDNQSSCLIYGCPHTTKLPCTWLKVALTSDQGVNRLHPSLGDGFRLVSVTLQVLALAGVPLRGLDGTVDLLVVLMPAAAGLAPPLPGKVPVTQGMVFVAVEEVLVEGLAMRVC